MRIDAALNMDDLTPVETAQKIKAIGIKHTSYDFLTTFSMAILGGAFIALGAIFATAVSTNPELSFGVNALLKGAAFSLGLILVVVAGAELFTGNSLLIIPLLSREAKFSAVLRNWGIVYLGNFVGALAMALVMIITRQYEFAGGELGKAMLTAANHKASLGFMQAIALGIMCNMLVCLAVWMSTTARTTAGKILAIVPPISAFVACGFEHSVANMYYVPVALLLKSINPAFISQAGTYANLGWGNFFLNNLLPVTIGNLVGGTIFVGAIYWFIYLRRQEKSQIQAHESSKKDQR